eukprot:scaffold20924_cov39-Prasinocladus_malaysianus.AAC.1
MAHATQADTTCIEIGQSSKVSICSHQTANCTQLRLLNVAQADLARQSSHNPAHSARLHENHARTPVTGRPTGYSYVRSA